MCKDVTNNGECRADNVNKRTCFSRPQLISPALSPIPDVLEVTFYASFVSFLAHRHDANLSTNVFLFLRTTCFAKLKLHV